MMMLEPRQCVIEDEFRCDRLSPRCGWRSETQCYLNMPDSMAVAAHIHRNMHSEVQRCFTVKHIMQDVCAGAAPLLLQPWSASGNEESTQEARRYIHRRAVCTLLQTRTSAVYEFRRNITIS
jgi:hypothetical protein